MQKQTSILLLSANAKYLRNHINTTSFRHWTFRKRPPPQDIIQGYLNGRRPVAEQTKKKMD